MKKLTKYGRRKKIAAIREAVMARANGKCECAGDVVHLTFDRFEVDHFFGGINRRSLESVETCWLLASSCHIQKTANSPSAAYWLERFIKHCERHNAEAYGDGYLHAKERAEARLESLKLQGRMSQPKPQDP